ncbi:ATP-binding protein [Kibdelosporangium aridum]|uniref:Tetratricopeptide repeat-containing protein n=1 Tax=Kibdelosporangium aridum TaxID=2030 RepID=A0A1W2D5U6_KIBAR|nr:tetratricopeptide repeat protein [Kibdelosporangium aridum]SMC92907.1 Tetratricopeptide repeat-containing protein [Kibdelosporangium aridum]
MPQVKLGDDSSPFGRELRRLRTRRGLSLQKLAELVNYTRGYIGKVETGDKPPTTELARRCDQVLEASGQLIALATSEGLPRLAQLPAAAATFVGREHQLSQLDLALSGDMTGTPWTVAIDGPPGVGKTALALRLAHQVKDRFPDGQLYVDLHGYSPDGQPSRPDVVLEEFLVALGTSAAAIPSSTSQRAALYRSLLDGSRILLVLDNARDSRQIEHLLPGSAGCGVIVTSRMRLGGLPIRQDQRITLGPLSEEESILLLRTVIGTSRTDDEPEATAGLARRCGHLPLALRIAAERVATHPHHSVDELADELGAEEERLDVLSTDDDSVAVRTVFSWSYRDLSGEAARMFRLIGLHRGPHLSVHAAAAMADIPVPHARRLLDRLVGVHLVQGLGGGRYRCHDLLRVYAAERALEEEPLEARNLAVQRVLHWYLQTCFEANHVLSPQRFDPPLEPCPFSLPTLTFGSYDEALAWCEAEMPNLIAAPRLALEYGEDAIAWKIPVGSFNFVFLRKRWSPWISAHELGIAGARRLGDRFGEAWTLNNVAHGFRELRRFKDAKEHLAEALEIRKQINDQVGLAWTLTAIGFVDCDQNEFAAAADSLFEALRIRSEVEREHAGNEALLTANKQGQGIARASLGTALRELGRYDEALDELTQALDIFREIADKHGEGYTLVKLGDLYARLRKPEDALANFEQALATRREIGDRWGEAETLHSRGRLLLDTGEAEAARESWHDALAIFTDLDDPRAEDVRALLSSTPRTAG